MSSPNGTQRQRLSTRTARQELLHLHFGSEIPHRKLLKYNSHSAGPGGTENLTAPVQSLLQQNRSGHFSGRISCTTRVWNLRGPESSQQKTVNCSQDRPDRMLFHWEFTRNRFLLIVTVLRNDRRTRSRHFSTQNKTRIGRRRTAQRIKIL